MNWYLEALRKYADFSGRSRRMEFWMFTLVSSLISIALIFIDFILMDTFGFEVGVLNAIYSLATIIPTLAVTVRRFHDIDRSGLSILFLLIPLIGGIIFLVMMLQEGSHGRNQYGPNPKEKSPRELIF